MAVAVSKQIKDGTAQQVVPPNHTIYVRNLPEKLHRDDIRRTLYMLFSTYGHVLDIITQKTIKMRGQAHVTFRDMSAANQAIRNCQGFEFFGRKMQISYAKTRSEVFAKLSGTTYKPKETESKPRAQQNNDLASLVTPPGPYPGAPSNLRPLSGLSKPQGELQPPAKPAPQDTPSPAGIKRPREESDDEDGAAGNEENDSGSEMEISDDD